MALEPSASGLGTPGSAAARILLLTRYGPLGASSRLRMVAYRSSLEASGAVVDVSPFFDDEYLNALYSGGRGRVPATLRAYRRRALALRRLRRYDVIWVEKELFPFLPGAAERPLARLGVPYLVDYDDATFHRYDRHRFWLVRRLLGHRLDGLIRGAEIVTACNAYLADYARAAGAKRVMLLPTVVDLEWYRVRPEPAADELRVGWIGSPSTARYLGVVKRPLEVLSGERPVRLVVIGASDIPDIGVPVERHLWSEATEAALLADVHLGIMPLLDGDWERGKCGYKLIQHMACGRPVIASPVGVNTEIVGAETGYLADDEEQWLQALRSLAAEPGRRREQGLAARRVVEAKYSLQVHAPTVVTLFSRLAAAARGRRRYGFEPGNGS